MPQTTATLTLGPVLYLWDGPKWRDFYFRIADEADVSRVVIGETVCSKRLHFTEPHIAEVVERLTAAGKEVVFSTLAMVTLERETQHVRNLIANAADLVEASDLSALGLLNGKPHVIGPLINVYNAATARLLAARGARTICLPPELPMDSISAIAAGAPDVDYEIFAFGRMPLAISARCAHARSKGHIKDNCQFVCADEPDGLPVRTLDRQSFLVLNGVQTVSHTCQMVAAEMRALREAGISRFRLSPQDCDMVGIAAVFNDLLQDRVGVEEAIARVETIYPGAPLSNGFLHAREGAAWVSRARNVAAQSAL
ncbi:U32 family peptidase [Pseudorhizobium endolithicum]|uniref:Ubiquinone biosynthesis protein UbiV n=1 Tax=Pseudorhizobium endolithicum TaxID=1191678 RepID=A0ABM8PMV1_9HYPH|nr:U32 family peptidase [Pseudorhizobium endolithicum]CAD7038542.1 U32 family peptidase [Pseudorhizobium endolithicum]